MIRVLLVDDEIDLAELLANQLTRAGFAVRCADSVSNAKEVNREGPFDVLVTDLSLPDGDAIDVARSVAIEARVAITGSAAEGDTRRLLGEGFAAVLVKPVTTQGLVTAINAAAARSPRRV